MKAKTKVKVQTPAGLVEAPCYHRWKQDVAGVEFYFALHIAAGHTKGVVAPLAISELSTGFDVKATIKHPVSGCVLTSANIQGIRSDEVKKVARAALHNLLYRKVGAGRFMQAMLRAQMQLAKVGREYAGHPDQLPPVLGGLATPAKLHLTCSMEPEQAAAMDKMLGGLDKPSTDNDYVPTEEEAAAAIADAEQINENMRKYGTIDAPTAEQLRERRSHLQERADQHGTMTGDTSEGEYGEVCEQIDELNDQIETLEGKPCSN